MNDTEDFEFVLYNSTISLEEVKYLKLIPKEKIKEISKMIRKADKIPHIWEHGQLVNHPDSMQMWNEAGELLSYELNKAKSEMIKI